jgi:hypothetical protein
MIEITEDIIKEYCNSKKAELISYVDNEDGTITVKCIIEHKIDYRSLDTHLTQQRLINK